MRGFGEAGSVGDGGDDGVGRTGVDGVDGVGGGVAGVDGAGAAFVKSSCRCTSTSTIGATRPTHRSLVIPPRRSSQSSDNLRLVVWSGTYETGRTNTTCSSCRRDLAHGNDVVRHGRRSRHRRYDLCTLVWTHGGIRHVLGVTGKA